MSDRDSSNDDYTDTEVEVGKIYRVEKTESTVTFGYNGVEKLKVRSESTVTVGDKLKKTESTVTFDLIDQEEILARRNYGSQWSIIPIMAVIILAVIIMAVIILAVYYFGRVQAQDPNTTRTRIELESMMF